MLRVTEKEFLKDSINPDIICSDVNAISTILDTSPKNVTILEDYEADYMTVAERLSERIGKKITSRTSLKHADSCQECNYITAQKFCYEGKIYLEYKKFSYVGYPEPTYYAAPHGNLSKIILSVRNKMAKKAFLPDGTKRLIKDRIIDYAKLASKNLSLPSSGFIFYGPPGNGKSLIVNNLLTRKKLNPTIVSNDAIREHSIHKHNRLTTYIFDDTDINFFDREGAYSATASYLLKFMDGERKQTNIFILTTNEDVGVIDRAFLRPGRFSTVVKVDNPTVELRQQFISSWDIKINVDKLVAETDGWSFSEVEFIKTLLTIQALNEQSLDVDKALEDFKTRKQEEEKYMGFRGN